MEKDDDHAGRDCIDVANDLCDENRAFWSGLTPADIQALDATAPEALPALDRLPWWARAG